MEWERPGASTADRGCVPTSGARRNQPQQPQPSRALQLSNALRLVFDTAAIRPIAWFLNLFQSHPMSRKSPPAFSPRFYWQPAHDRGVRKKQGILATAFVIAALALSVAVWQSTRSDEPVYQGKNLSAWLRELPAKGTV